MQQRKRPFHTRPSVTVLAEIKVLCESHGKATIIQAISGSGPIAGEIVNLKPEVRQALRGDEEGGWGPGDKIVLTVEGSSGSGQWVATRAVLRHAKNQRKPELTFEQAVQKHIENSYPNFEGRIGKVFREAIAAGLELAEIKTNEPFMAAFEAAQTALGSGASNRGVVLNELIARMRGFCVQMVAVRRMADSDAAAAERLPELLVEPELVEAATG